MSSESERKSGRVVFEKDVALSALAENSFVDHGAVSARDGRLLARAAQFLRERVRKLAGLLARTRKQSENAVQAAPRSLIYALCEEYRRLDLWACYAAFRRDPQAHRWDKLRRQRVPWQHEQTVDVLVHRLCSFNNRRTPDPAMVGQAIVNTSATRSKSARRTAQ